MRSDPILAFSQLWTKCHLAKAKKRKEAAVQRAREAPAKKADAAAKLVSEGIAAHKKTDEYKTEQKDNQSRIRELLKQYMKSGLDMDAALDKATDEVLG